MFVNVRGIVAVLVATSCWAQYDTTPTIETPKAQSLPSLGDASSAIISPEQEREIGEMFLQNVRASVPLVDDPVMKYYLRRIVYELAEHSELGTTHLYPVIIEAKELNAFAAPGGVLGINVGLFVHAADVHQFASVVAHELAHLSQRHYARSVELQKAASIQSVVGAILSTVLAAVGDTDAAMMTMIGTTDYLTRSARAHSRSAEHEADRIGFNTLVRAGFDPHGTVRMFDHMSRLFNDDNIPTFLRTHPVTTERVTDARNNAQSVGDAVFSGSEDYQFMRARASLLLASSPNSEVASVDLDNVDRPSKYRHALTLAGVAKWEESIRILSELRRSSPDSILLTASLAEVLISAEQHDAAKRILEQSLEINPDNAPLSMMYARALDGLEKYEEALRVLRRQTRIYDYDQDIWYVYAETAGLAGNTVEVHRGRAEYFALQGRNNEAVSQLKYARDLVEENSWLASSIDQRIEELRGR